MYKVTYVREDLLNISLRQLLLASHIWASFCDGL